MRSQLTRLADHCEVITKGTTPTTLGFNFAISGVPFLRVQNIEGGGVNYTRDMLFIDPETHQALERSQIQPGDVLVSIAGTIGRAAVVPDGAPPLNCNQAVAILRTRRVIHRPFLRHWLESVDAQAQIRGVTVTGTISNLSLTQLGNLKLPLLALADQQRVAGILDKAEALRANRRATLVQLDALVQSIFLDLFGDPKSNPCKWPERGFDDVIRDETSRSEILQQSEYLPAGRFAVVDQGHTDIAGYCDDPRYLCQSTPPVVVFGDHTRAVKLVRAPFVIGAEGAKVLVPHSGLGAEFLSWLLRLAPIPNLGYSRHMREVRRLRFPVPPVDLQRTFSDRVATIDNVRITLLASMAQLDTLFASLQYRAFRGDL